MTLVELRFTVKRTCKSVLEMKFRAKRPLLTAIGGHFHGGTHLHDAH